MGTKCKWTRDGFSIRDTEHYSTSMSNICMTDTYSDLTLISEEGTRFPAHRSFLAARSDYFSALLYGGLKESSEDVVTLMCSDEVLKSILNFLYSGKIDLQSSSVDFLMNLMDVARLMCIDNFKEALGDLIINVFIRKPPVCFDSIKTVIKILNVAIDKDFKDLIKFARKRLERHIDEVLMSSDHLQSFSVLSLKTLLSGNDLDVPEIEIFRGVLDWMSTKEITSEEKSLILSEVRLDQMTTKQLVRDVHPSGMFSEGDMFAAISSQETIVKKGNTRKVILNKNLCLSSLVSMVINALHSPLIDEDDDDYLDVIINGKTNVNDYNQRIGYVMSQIGERLEVLLSSRQKINKIKILLHDKDALSWDFVGGSMQLVEKNKEYSYRIETSLDGDNWEVIADFSDYKCKSWQTVYFKERRVEYIGIIGTRESSRQIIASPTKSDEINGKTPSGYIHVVAIEAMLDTNTEEEYRKNSGMTKIIELKNVLH